MHHGTDFEFAQCRDDRRCVRYIGFDQRALSHELAMSRCKIIQSDRKIAGFRQRLAAMGADVSGASGYHHCTLIG